MIGWVFGYNEETRNAHRNLMGKLLGIFPLGRLRRRDDNIKMDVEKEIGCEDQRWMKLAHDCVQ
jgi:hypothetical protein